MDQRYLRQVFGLTSLATTLIAFPTSRGFPGCLVLAQCHSCDVGSRLPLRGSPGFTPGSLLSLRDKGGAGTESSAEIDEVMSHVNSFASSEILLNSLRVRLLGSSVRNCRGQGHVTT